MKRDRLSSVWEAAGLYLAWTLATYLLEGRMLTFQSPQADLMRLTYALVANILIGTAGTMLLIRYLFDTGHVSRPSLFGVAGRSRTALGLGLGLAFGVVFGLTQPWPSREAVIFFNAYAQVLPVSTAEVLVCWVLVGGTVAGVSRKPRYLTAIVVSALAFGLYHFGHSPPFNQPAMVRFLTVTGLVTGAFYFATRSVYGTILFHNFLGTKGVMDALAGRQALETFASPRLALMATALAALGTLIVLDLYIVRPVVLRRQIRTGRGLKRGPGFSWKEE